MDESRGYMDTGNKKILGVLDSLIPRTWTIVITLALMLNSLGCNPKSTKTGSIEGYQLEWSDMDISQRKRHMEQVILPVATSVFQSWRPDHYTKIDCTLCHGQGFQVEDFHMPTTHLPRLSGKLLLGPEFESHPETTRLKLNRLVPEMAEALGKNQFSLITRKGFGCYSCHLGPTGPMFGN